MESDVAQTLTELERKLKELERELETVGREADAEPDPEPAPGPSAQDVPAPPPAADGAPAAVPLDPPAQEWYGAGASWSGTGFAVQPVPEPEPEPASHVVPPPPPGVTPTPAPGLHHQLDELLAFRERLVESTNELVAELSRVLSDLGIEVAPPEPPGPEALPFSGALVLEAGPFPDLATLAAFEQAVAQTPGVAEVAVRGLDRSTATFDVVLGETIPLGGALLAASPVPLTITAAEPGHLALALSPAGGPSPG